MSGTVGTCTTGPRATLGARTILQDFNFLGDGNALTNPLNFVQTSSGVTVNDIGDAYVPAGDYIMSKKSFSRPFSLRVLLQPTLPMVQFSSLDRSIVLRAGVSQPTLSTDGIRAIAGAPNASFQLIGSTTTTGATTINPTYANAAFSTSTFQEHRLEMYNTQVLYYVNNVLIYSVADSGFPSGTVGIGFNAQGVTVRSFTVESLAPELLSLNISGSPVNVQTDVFFTSTGLPSATGATVDATTGILTLSGATNFDSTTKLMVTGSDGTINASSVALCPTLYTTMNPVTGALTYRCVPRLGAGTYNIVPSSATLGGSGSPIQVTVALIVTSVTPSSIPLGGGRVTIVGAGFWGDISVLLGSSAATIASFNSSMIIADMTSVTPSSIPLGGGRVTIVGAGFWGDISVLLGSSAATIASFNSSMIIADIPASSTSGTVSLIVRDASGANVQSISLTITTLSPFNITGISSQSATLWSTVTITGTGFSTGVLVYVGGNIAILSTVSASRVVFQIRSTTANMFGNTTIKIVQPGVGIATSSINIIPYVYSTGLTPHNVSSLGGAVVTIPGVSFLNIALGTPTATVTSNFVTGGVSSWTVTPAVQNAPAPQTTCGVPYFGPFNGISVLSRSYGGLAAHEYVRVVARLAVPYDWSLPVLIVEGRASSAITTICDFSSTGCAYPCIAELAVIVRHSATTLSVSVQGDVNPIGVSSVTVDTYQDIGYYANISGAIAPIDRADRLGATFTVPANTPVAEDQVITLIAGGANYCLYNLCKLTVVAPPTVQYATVVDIHSASTAPHFVADGTANVSYRAGGTSLSDAVAIDHVSTQRIYAADGPVIRVSATVNALPVSTNVSWLTLTNQKFLTEFGLYTSSNGRVNALAYNRYVYTGSVLKIGDVISFEYDTRTSTASYLYNGIRFASTYQKVFWPLALVYQGPQPLVNVTVWGTNLPTEQRIVLYGTNLTQQGMNTEDSNVATYINGTRCRSTFVTNGQISCYIAKGTYHAGDLLNVTFSTPLGSGSNVVLLLRPYLTSVDASSGGSTGGLRVTLVGGPVANGSSSVSICSDSTVRAGAQAASVACTTSATSASSVVVTLTTNGATSFVTSSTSLVASTPAVVDASQLTFAVVTGPVLSAVTLGGASLGIDGTDIPTDATVVLSSGTCNITTINSTRINCDLVGVAPGLQSVNIYSPTIGAAATSLPFTVSLTLVSATPSSLGVGGFVELDLLGSGFGADGDGLDVAVTINNASICVSIYRMDSVLICTTAPGELNGNVVVTVASASDVWSVTSSFIVATNSALAIPTVTAVSPASGLGAQTLTITGTLLSAVNYVVLGTSLPCAIVSQTSTSLVCSIATGFPAGHYIVRAIDPSVGASVNTVAYNALLDMTSVAPGQGPKVGGQLVTIFGTGFSATGHSVLLGGNPCSVASATTTYLTCYSSALNNDFTTDYDVTINVADDTNTEVDATSQYTYTAALTAVVSSVSPTELSAGGQELLTISGSNFGTDISSVSVKIGNSSCIVQSLTNTTIQCRTTPTSPVNDALVSVTIGDSGAAASTSTVSLKFAITSIVGTSVFSVEGGAVLTLAGEGFWTFNAGDWQASYYNVTLDGWLVCNILTSSWAQLTCLLPPSPRALTKTPPLSSSYIMRPEATMAITLQGNSIIATVADGVVVQYSLSVTPTITNVTLNSATTAKYGSVVTITGTSFASSGNIVTVNNASCFVQSQSATSITCVMTAGNYGPGFVQVTVPGVGLAATVRTCPNGGFLNCNGQCLTDDMCRYDAWGDDTCSDLAIVTVGDTFCNANGGADSTDTPFLTDAGVVFDLNCPMYSCEGNDCNSSLSIGGHGAIISSCGSDPNGFLIDFRAEVTAITGGVASSLGGGLSLTISGNYLPGITAATVLFGGVNCAIISANGNEIVCVTGASTNGTALSVAVYGGGYLAQCADAICSGLYSYDNTITPTISTGTYTASSTYPTVTLSGMNFPTSSSGLSVWIGTTSCPVFTTSATEVVCNASFALGAGSQSLVVSVASAGYAVGASAVTIPLTIFSYSPINGSMAGGTILTLYASGLTNVSTLTVGACAATITSLNTATGVLIATTAACGSASNAAVVVKTGSVTTTATQRFAQTSTFTPTVTGTVTNNIFTLTLGNLGTTSAGAISIFVDQLTANCIVSSFNLPTVSCEMEGGYTAGSYNLTVYVAPRGYASRTVATLVASYALSVTSLSASTGLRGGNQALTIGGSGFGTNTASVSVKIGNATCTVTSVTATSIGCNTGFAAAGTYNVVVSVQAANAVSYPTPASFASFTYQSASPTVTSVYPTRGSTAGGTLLTIMGTGLTSAFTVNVAGQVCTQSSAEQVATAASGGATLYCTTAAYQPMYSPVAIRVIPSGGLGDAFNDGTVTYQYIDLWSRWTTWGNSPPPQFGDSAVVSEGDVVMVDYSPPRFFLIIVMGTMLFDDTTDITVECTYIMINYGRLIVGTPEKPYTHHAVIRLWGDRLTPEIPVHGSKVVALRHGSIDMHGVKRQPTWTRVATTAYQGTTTIYVNGPVDWQIGEFIVIAPTDFDPMEGETRMITGVINGDTANVTLVLEAPLDYTHWGVRQCFDGNNLCVDEIAEVGLLTRNIVVEGEPNSQNIGFAGTMFLMPLGQDASAYCRLSFIEVRNVGQQYIVGRYPVHFHVTGESSNSYVNGTSVHDSLNRAFSIHGTSNNTYVDNVAFNIAGHAFFIEDGSERYNVINHNLVIQVLATTSNLNTDITPAAIWVTAPMNYIDNNAVSGSQTFGIWIMPFSPSSTGPTFNLSICPYGQALGSMDNNTAHSNLWHGFHVFQVWTPFKRECSSSSGAAPAVIRNFVAYKNQIWGAAMGNLEIGRVGAVVMDNLTSADNGFQNADGASFWIEHMQNLPNMSCGLQNSLLIARTNNNPYTRSASRRGVNLPQDDNFFVENVTFVNFDQENYGFEPQAWAHFRSLCFPYGWEVMMRGLRWVNSPNRILFRFQHHGILNDVDGTLSGTAGAQVVPYSLINNAPQCSSIGSFSPMYPGLVCPNSYKIRRFGVSSSNTPQLDQIWRIDGRTELNYAIDRAYVFTAPINKVINITFQTTATPDWWWKWGGVAFMQPGEKALFVTKYLQFPYRAAVAFNGLATNTTYWGRVPQITDNVSSYAFDNISGNISALLVYPITGFTATSNQCPTWGCAVEVVTQTWEKKCFHITDASGWGTSSAPSSTTAAVVPAGVHFCLGYNATVAAASERFMEEQSVPRTCTAANQVTTYNFQSLTVFGAISLTNANCPCQGGSIVINIAKFIYIVGGGFLLGNETLPITDCTVTINMLQVVWTAADLSTYRNGIYGYRALTLEAGLLSLHGNKPEPIFARLSATAAAGSRTLVLESAVQWSVGDTIAIAGTNRAQKYATQSTRIEQSEYNYITAISADKKTLTLQNALAYSHYGAGQQTLNGISYSIGAEVAVLSRTITIAGDTAIAAVPQYNAGWKMNIGCTPQNRDGCQPTQVMSATRWGLAQVEGVFMKDIGQGSMDDGAINLDGLTDGVNNAKLSYFRNNAFWKAYNTPIFVRDTTTGIEISGNVAYDLWNDGINVASAGNNITSNLMIRMINTDPLCEPAAYNIFWSCRNGMYRIHAGNTVQNNIAASTMTAGFVTEGEFCTTSSSTWSNNVVHSARDGVLVADAPAEGTWGWSTYSSPTDCRTISGILSYWSADHGIVGWGPTGNVTVQNFVSVDDQIGTFIMTTQSGQFQTYIPEVNYYNITYSNRWNNNDFSCRSNFLAVPQPCRSTTFNTKFWCEFFTSTTQAMLVGNVGAMETIFASTALSIGPTHGEHKNMWEELDQYSTVGGHATYRDIHFANYDGMTTCGYRNLAFFQSSLSNDTFHQHTFARVSWSNVAADGKVFFWRTYGIVSAWPTDIRTTTYWLDFNNYIHGAYWPDSPNKQLINDIDGTFTQTGSRSSIVASETLTRTSTFDQIGYDGLAFTGGKLAQARTGCTWQTNMNGYICDSTYKWLSLNLDSLADDQLTRRAGPIVICKGDGMVAANGDPNCPGGAIDFTSGPVMKGKTQRSTLDRLSRWRMWAEDGGNYTLAFRGSPPSWIRLQLQDYEYLGQGQNVGININLRYFGLNANSRVGVYINGKRITSNIGFADPWNMVPAQQWPNSSAPAGTHFMNLVTYGSGVNISKKNILYLTIRPGVLIDLIQEPVIQVNMQVAMTIDQFFDKKDTFVAAMASVLGIDASRIKITSIVAGTTRRRTGSSVQVGFEIEQDPNTLTTPTDTTGNSVGGGVPSTNTELTNLVSTLDVLTTNPNVIAQAANDPSMAVSGVTAQSISVTNSRPAVTVASGTPYLSLNVTTPTGVNDFNGTEVANLIANWVATNFSSVGSPYNTTVADGTLAIGNIWTNSTTNVTQFTIMFTYDNNTYGYAALRNLEYQFLHDSNAVLPAYGVQGMEFASNNYVPDTATTAPGPSPPAALTGSVENITKFAIGIGIGVAIVMVIGGAGLYHFLIVQPKLKLKNLEEEKVKLRELIGTKKKSPNGGPGPAGHVNNSGETMVMFPRADETA
ncbi:transmembrane protein, putative [Bodo saltans]|uniref:Transmembrane protein, putative n=1 Tax=Bodo saltans TaxID=75058 RepID=A0A0S4J777_BODSA|nr:transmembrane protein, putative [Bodo saltans]|eukprot:CUG86307.1 transmembrane protein, putative [Bodo saltans]